MSITGQAYRAIDTRPYLRARCAGHECLHAHAAVPADGGAPRRRRGLRRGAGRREPAGGDRGGHLRHHDADEHHPHDGHHHDSHPDAKATTTRAPSKPTRAASSLDALREELSALSRSYGVDLGVAATETRSERSFTWGADTTIETASIAKADILATLLLQLQDRARASVVEPARRRRRDDPAQRPRVGVDPLPPGRPGVGDGAAEPALRAAQHPVLRLQLGPDPHLGPRPAAVRGRDQRGGDERLAARRPLGDGAARPHGGRRRRAEVGRQRGGPRHRAGLPQERLAAPVEPSASAGSSTASAGSPAARSTCGWRSSASGTPARDRASTSWSRRPPSPAAPRSLTSPQTSPLTSP